MVEQFVLPVTATIVLLWIVAAAPGAKGSARDAYGAWLCGCVGGLLVGWLLYEGTHSGPLHPPWRSGLSAHGVLLGAALGGGFYLRWRGRAVLPWAAAAAPAAAFAYAVARLGCYVNGDDFGRLSTSPWAVTFRPGTTAFAAHAERGWVAAGAPASIPVEPVQLYGAALGLVLCAALLALRRRPPGVRASLGVIGYGVGRFLLEWLRDDFRPWLGPFSLPQVLSVALIVAGLAVVARRRAGATAAAVPLVVERLAASASGHVR